MTAVNGSALDKEAKQIMKIIPRTDRMVLYIPTQTDSLRTIMKTGEADKSNFGECVRQECTQERGGFGYVHEKYTSSRRNVVFYRPLSPSPLTSSAR